MLRFMAAALSTPANPSATRLIQGDINADTVPAMNVFVGRPPDQSTPPCTRLDRSYTGLPQWPMPCPWLRERSFWVPFGTPLPNKTGHQCGGWWVLFQGRSLGECGGWSPHVNLAVPDDNTVDEQAQIRTPELRVLPPESVPQQGRKTGDFLRRNP